MIHALASSPRPGRLARAPLGCAGLLALLGVWASPAHPQTAQPPVSPALDRASLSIGAFSAEPRIGAAVGNAWGHYDTGLLKTRRETLPRVSAEFLLGRNHGIALEAFRYSQNYSDPFARGYASGPFGLAAVGSASLDFSLDVARLGYRYWFGSDSTVVGVGAGLGYYRVKLDTTAFAAGGADLGLLGFHGFNGHYTRRDSEDAVAPMLEVGLRHAFTPDLRLFFDGSGIHKGGGGVHGSIYNAALGLEWFPLRNLGVSLAYAVTDVDLKRHDAGLQRLRLKFQGPVLGVKARF